MAIHTTMYLHNTTTQAVEDAARLTGRNRNDVITELLKTAMTDVDHTHKTGHAVQYQPRDRSGKWTTLHVHIREDEIDYFRDLRGFLKLSVSYILAIAARKFIAKLIKKSKNNERMDNYPHSNYILSREELDGYVFWKICWGFPPDPTAYGLL